MKGYGRFLIASVVLFQVLHLTGETSAQIAPPPQLHLYEKAGKLYREGLHDQSARYYRLFLETSPDRAMRQEALYYLTLSEMAQDSLNHDIYVYRFLHQFPFGKHATRLLDDMAGRYEANGNFEYARKYFHEAYLIEKAPEERARFLFLMAEASRELSEPDSSSALYTILARAYRDTRWAPKALYSRGELYLTLERYDESTMVFEELRERFPTHPVTRQIGTALGEVYYRQGLYEDAIRVLRSELTYLEHEALLKALLLIAESHNYLGEFDEAAASYRRYINLSEDEMQARPAHYGLGWVYHKQRVYHWAARSFSEAALGNDELARKALYYQAANEKLSGRHDLALETFEKFGERYRSGFWVEVAYYEWALAAFEMGHYDLAIDVLQRLVRGESSVEDPGRIYSLLGEAYFANNEFSRAIQAFEMAEQTTEVRPELRRQARFQRAWVMYENHAYREAAREFEAVYRDEPGDTLAAEALFWSGDSYYHLNRWDDAIRQFERYLQGFPGHRFNGAAAYSLGWVYFSRGEFDQAIQYFEAFINDYEPPPVAMYPYEVDTRLRIGDSFYALGRYDQALSQYERVASTDSGGDYAIYQMANSFFRLNQTFEAVGHFRRLLEQFPVSRLREQALYNVGYIYFLIGNYDQAIQEFHNLINLFPQTEWAARAQYQIGDAYYNAGRYQEAIDAYRMILDEYPRSAYIVNAVNGIQFAQLAAGMEDTSLQILENFLNQHPQTGTADQLRFLQAENLMNAGDYEEAISAFQHYLRVTTSESLLPEAWYRMGEAYEQRQNWSAALDAYDEIVTYYYESDRVGPALLHMGRIRFEQGDLSGSIEALEQLAARQDRLQIEALAALGEVYLSNGQAGRAETAYDQALALRPGHEPSLIGKGRVALQRGQFLDAQRYFRQVAQASTMGRGAEAQYLLGVVEQSRGNHDAAIDAFARVQVLYETQVQWVAEAMLATAESYRRLGQAGRAQQTLREVIQRFPDTDFARRASEQL